MVFIIYLFTLRHSMAATVTTLNARKHDVTHYERTISRPAILVCQFEFFFKFPTWLLVLLSSKRNNINVLLQHIHIFLFRFCTTSDLHKLLCVVWAPSPWWHVGCFLNPPMNKTQGVQTNHELWHITRIFFCFFLLSHTPAAVVCSESSENSIRCWVCPHKKCDECEIFQLLEESLWDNVSAYK